VHGTPAQEHWLRVPMTDCEIGTKEKETPITDSKPEPITKRVLGTLICMTWTNDATDATMSAADTKSAARN
jgi:hypothetical protein